MPKRCLDWDTMFQALLDYHKRMGHCNVPANWKENPQLGRWVATVRFRRKVEGLPATRVKMLDSIGFIWSPSDVAWNEMFNQLVEFKKKEGHCNVPAQWKKNLHLANWVANQRHRRKMGTLPTDRVRCMEALGFEWAIYGQNTVRVKEPEPVEDPERLPEERLYVLGHGEYVQHDGHKDMPAALKKFVELHHDEFPPYIPLPDFPTTFHLGENPMIRGRKVQWAGKGRLPKIVFDYVCENGVLPPHD